MDKHELNVKVEQMRKQAGLGDYQTAVKIADKIDWRRVSNVSLLTQVSEIYEKVGKYAEARIFCFWRSNVPRWEGGCSLS